MAAAEREPRVTTWKSVRAGRYYVVLSGQTCWKCSNRTKMVAVGLPTGYESLGDGGRWYRSPTPAIARNVTKLSDQVAERICAGHVGFRFGISKSAKISYWFNHCLTCGAKQGDHMAHTQPGGAFFPTSTAQAAEMDLVAIPEPIELVAGELSDGIALIDSMHVYDLP